jgi:type IV secretory pathway protease TraF
MAARGYLPSGVALLKHIAALPGQIICRADHAIIIDRKAIAVARNRDRMGRSLPSWQGCRMLRAGEVFVLNADVPDSFDGRYFGILPVKSIAARADPLWTMEQ